MHLKYSKKFLKNFDKRIAKNTKLKNRFKERLGLFLENPQNPVLKNHRLVGARKYLSSFSVTGDIRVLFHQESNAIYFVDIGSHNQVY